MRGVGFEPTTSRPNKNARGDFEINKNNKRSGIRTYHLLAEGGDKGRNKKENKLRLWGVDPTTSLPTLK